MKIFPYRNGSKSCRFLSKALGCKVLKHNSGTYAAKASETIINWGSHVIPQRLSKGRIINDPHWVRAAANKLSTFRILEQAKVSTVPWTTSKDKAKEWLKAGSKIVCRKILNGSAGHGIEIIEKGLDIPSCPLYTRYTPKEAEWRIHVAFGKVLDAQRKVRDPDKEPTNWQIRSHDNGFIFVRNSGSPTSKVTLEAVKAVQALCLDFGAVDIITDKQGSVYVLEINSAPGLQGLTIESYRKAFSGLR